MPRGVKIGITGLPGAGKTEAVRRIIEMVSEDIKAGGMITEAIREKGKRVGFKVTNIATEEEGVLAHVDIGSRVRVGKYKVNLEDLERIGVKAIEDATKHADLVIVDEIGRMEVESERFVRAVKKALDTNKHVLLTLHKKSRNPLLQDIRRRDDVRILEVTPINRGILPYKIVRLLRGEIL